jgi:hypothetical protein
MCSLYFAGPAPHCKASSHKSAMCTVARPRPCTVAPVPYRCSSAWHGVPSNQLCDSGIQKTRGTEMTSIWCVVPTCRIKQHWTMSARCQLIVNRCSSSPPLNSDQCKQSLHRRQIWPDSRVTIPDVPLCWHSSALHALYMHCRQCNKQLHAPCSSLQGWHPQTIEVKPRSPSQSLREHGKAASDSTG